MKLHELFRLNEGVTHTVQKVSSPDDLRDADGNFLSGTINVAGSVDLSGLKLERLPVKFGSVGGDFTCSRNLLPSLVGAPSTVGGGFNCNRNRLTSLVGVHKILKQIGGGLYIWRNEIMTGGIGLVLVEGLTKIDADQPALRIINKYLGQGMKGVLRCQEELHDAGFEEYAKI